MGFIISVFTVASQDAAPPSLVGQATTLGLFTRSVGSAIGVPLLGLVAGIDPSATGFASIDGLGTGLERVFVAVALLVGISGLVSFVLFPSNAPREPSTR